MPFTDQELGWTRYAGVVQAKRYDDIREVVPFDDFGGLQAAVCLFNPIREKLTGRIVPWESVSPRAPNRQALVDQIERWANFVDQTWDERLVVPLIGAPDPVAWAVLDGVLPHESVKAALFPMGEVNELELDWPSLAGRLAANDYDAPVVWWDTARTFVVATPYESALTYVAGSAALIEQITARSNVETERIF